MLLTNCIISLSILSVPSALFLVNVRYITWISFILIVSPGKTLAKSIVFIVLNSYFLVWSCSSTIDCAHAALVFPGISFSRQTFSFILYGQRRGLFSLLFFLPALRISLCGCTNCLQGLEVPIICLSARLSVWRLFLYFFKFVIITNFWIDLSLSALFSIVFSCIQTGGRNFWDVSVKFNKLTCFSPRLNTIENGSDRNIFTI